MGFHSKSSDGCQKKMPKDIRFNARSLLLIDRINILAAGNVSFSLRNLQSSDIHIASATSLQEHFTTVPQKLHFSPELIVTINSGKPTSVGNFNINSLVAI
jgi:hypothetical protein